MKKKKNKINTLPLEEVFAPFVFADLDNGAIYDTKSKMAIGHIKFMEDKIGIKLFPPVFLDDERKVISKNLTKYLSEQVYQDLSHQLYFPLGCGYVHIGEIASSGVYAELALPRVYQEQGTMVADNDDQDDFS